MSEASTPRARGPRPTRAATQEVAARYFGAIADGDVEAAVACWAPGGEERVRGMIETEAPDGVRAFLRSIFDAMPDARFEVCDMTVEGERAAVRWRASGTFAGAPFNGFQATGRPVTLEGCDVLVVRGRLIVRNDAYPDGMGFARAAGLLPDSGSVAERGLAAVTNARTRAARRLRGGGARAVAEGVWVVQGQPARCNVYLIEDPPGGVTMFDAGARTMVTQVATAAAALAGVRRIVLGHGHTDHRGVAPSFDVPILCHPDEVKDAEGSGGFRYWGEGLPKLPEPTRTLHRVLHRRAWDGGPVRIAGTLEEGEEVAGFRVVHLPGHAPGLIALWRCSDRLALCSDCFYTLDGLGRDSAPHVPMPAYNLDTEQARRSMLALAALEPAAAWPGHARPVLGDVRGALERAARAA